jgi:hypothetical protein
MTALAVAAALNMGVLLDVIRYAESGGSPYCQGEARVETLPKGHLTLARGCWQILDTTLELVEPGTEPAWMAYNVAARRVARKILAECVRFYPHGSVQRLAYCWRAGKWAEPYKRSYSREYSERVAALYAAAMHTPTIQR